MGCLSPPGPILEAYSDPRSEAVFFGVDETSAEDGGSVVLTASTTTGPIPKWKQTALNRTNVESFPQMLAGRNISRHPVPGRHIKRN